MDPTIYTCGSRAHWIDGTWEILFHNKFNRSLYSISCCSWWEWMFSFIPPILLYNAHCLKGHSGILSHDIKLDLYQLELGSAGVIANWQRLKQIFIPFHVNIHRQSSIGRLWWPSHKVLRDLGYADPPLHSSYNLTTVFMAQDGASVVTSTFQTQHGRGRKKGIERLDQLSLKKPPISYQNVPHDTLFTPYWQILVTWPHLQGHLGNVVFMLGSYVPSYERRGKQYWGLWVVFATIFAWCYTVCISFLYPLSGLLIIW